MHVLEKTKLALDQKIQRQIKERQRFNGVMGKIRKAMTNPADFDQFCHDARVKTDETDKTVIYLFPKGSPGMLRGICRAAFSREFIQEGSVSPDGLEPCEPENRIGFLREQLTPKTEVRVLTKNGYRLQ